MALVTYPLAEHGRELENLGSEYPHWPDSPDDDDGFSRWEVHLAKAQEHAEDALTLIAILRKELGRARQGDDQ